MKRVLLLNSSYAPLTIVTERRALNLMFKGKVECVQSGDFEYSLNTATHEYFIPAILRMKTFVKHVPKAPTFRKYVLFNRDDWTCQYCAKQLSKATATVDHIVPKSKGGKTTWKNCVTACYACNRKKSNHLLEQTHLNLIAKPATPTITHYWDKRSIHPDWSQFLLSS